MNLESYALFTTLEPKEKRKCQGYVFCRFSDVLAADYTFATFADFISFKQLSWPLVAQKLASMSPRKLDAFDRRHLCLSCDDVAQYVKNTYNWDYYGYWFFCRVYEYAVLCFDKGVYLLTTNTCKFTLLEAEGTIEETAYYMLQYDSRGVDLVYFICLFVYLFICLFVYLCYNLN